MIGFSVELIKADPFDASSPLLNVEEVKGRIVLVERGKVPLVFKVHFAQEVGALGVVIADLKGSCKDKFDQRCVPGADQSRGEGFGAQDNHELWQKNHIPCVLLHQAPAKKILDLIERISS
jgi:hypothetical protein